MQLWVFDQSGPFSSQSLTSRTSGTVCASDGWIFGDEHGCRLEEPALAEGVFGPLTVLRKMTTVTSRRPQGTVQRGAENHARDGEIQ
jgi:hypothetical protein